MALQLYPLYGTNPFRTNISQPKLIPMSDPNTRAIATSNSFSSIKVAHIGKYMVPVFIIHICAVNTLPWKKSARFSNVKILVYSLPDACSIGGVDEVYTVKVVLV